MKTIQITIQEVLLKQIDGAIRRFGTTRSAFVRQALADTLKRLQDKQWEKRHRDGYRKKPSGKAELGTWEDEQAWGE